MYKNARCPLTLLSALIFTACSGGTGTLKDIVDPSTEPMKLYSEDIFEFTEGPCVSEDGTLYFTDGPPGKVYRMDGINSFTAVIMGAGRPDGMMVDREGNLVVCDFKNKKLDIYAPDGRLLKTLAGSYNGKGLNGPNDCVIDRGNGIYFTDPSFNKPNSLQGEEGVYYVRPGGEILRVAGGFEIPNGIILTPDEKTLIVVDYDSPVIRAFDVNDDGTLSNDRVWAMATMPDTKPEKEDRWLRTGIGVAMDVEANLYVSTSLGMEIFDKSGRSLGVLKFSEFDRPTNMTFDRRDPYTLYMTTGNGLYSLKTKVKGVSFPQYD